MTRLSRCLVLSTLVLTTAGIARAQYNERPFLPGSGQKGCDCSGRSIKNMRVRAIHTTDASLRGGTAWMFEQDPFLAYQLGRNLNFREFRERDGTFDARISPLIGPMPDGTTAKITANNQTSCLGCHNLPPGNPGGGTNFHKDSGLGRNAPHYYGAGIVEMLALQVRTAMLQQIDRNGDGWVSAREAELAGNHVLVRTGDGGESIDYGRPLLVDGKPDLNNIFRVWYVDGQGKVVPGATRVDGQRTKGYNFEMVVWGWGQGPGRSALNPTNRAFLWDPFKTHGGLDSFDPSTNDDPDQDGISAPTLAGAIQFPVTHSTSDKGVNRDPLGFSRDDPDGDGHLTEISEGDLDLAEWFMLNAPRPAFAGTRQQYQRGVHLLKQMACTECHVADWTIESRNDQIQLEGRTSLPSVFAGDRRLFDFDVQWNRRNARLEGKVVPLYDKIGSRYVRRFGEFQVTGLFSDLRHHDMGKGFEEIDFGGTVNHVWRTPPLWGVGSGFPWGHDGASLTIEDAILRHTGEGEASRAAYLRANDRKRAELLEFLGKLVLYDIESLPADVDGDGQIAEHFSVAGRDTGLERFNAEWLFRVPLQIQGPFRNIDGITVRSFAGVNIDAAYGQTLPLRIDSDADGWPDVWDHAPSVPGYRDGVR